MEPPQTTGGGQAPSAHPRMPASPTMPATPASPSMPDQSPMRTAPAAPNPPIPPHPRNRQHNTQLNERGGAYWGEQAPPQQRWIGGNRGRCKPRLRSDFSSVLQKEDTATDGFRRFCWEITRVTKAPNRNEFRRIRPPGAWFLTLYDGLFHGSSADTIRANPQFHAASRSPPKRRRSASSMVR